MPGIGSASVPRTPTISAAVFFARWYNYLLPRTRYDARRRSWPDLDPLNCKLPARARVVLFIRVSALEARTPDLAPASTPPAHVNVPSDATPTTGHYCGEGGFAGAVSWKLVPAGRS